MPLKIPTDVRASIIRDWLNGKPRDIIAHDNMVSTGAVSNIINKFKGDLADCDVDALRELGITFQKLGITAQQSAIGFRLASILKDLGVDEEKFGDFVSEIYNQCKDIGLKPEYIAYNTKQILDLSGSIPLSEIPNYIQEKTSQRRELEQAIKRLEEHIKKLVGEELEARTELMVALDENKVYLTELAQFSKLKVELDKLGISTDDIPRTTEIIQGLQKSGYNLDSIKQLVSDWTIRAHLEKNIKDLTDKQTNLQNECDRLEELISAHRLKESLFKKLEAWGFGLPELKILFYTIKEVAAENKMVENQAVQKFFEDIERNYDNKLGYDSMLERLKSEMEKTKRELNTARSELSLNKGVAQVTDLLTRFSGQEILDFACFLEIFYNNTELLISDVKKYGSVEKIIEVISQKFKKTKSIEVKRDSTNIPGNDDGKSSGSNTILFGYPYHISAFLPNFFYP
jgi:DNA-binding transcriptional MerR regulator